MIRVTLGTVAVAIVIAFLTLSGDSSGGQSGAASSAKAEDQFLGVIEVCASADWKRNNRAWLEYRGQAYRLPVVIRDRLLPEGQLSADNEDALVIRIRRESGTVRVDPSAQGMRISEGSYTYSGLPDGGRLLTQRISVGPDGGWRHTDSLPTLESYLNTGSAYTVLDLRPTATTLTNGAP